MRTLSLILLLTLLSTAVDARAPSTLELKANQERTIPGSSVKVRFNRVVEDSRCPINARCVWAGNAKVSLTVTRGKDRRTVELNSGLEPRIVEVHGFKLSIDELSPHPGEPRAAARLVLAIDR